jgi:hypothetical protein
MLRCRLRRQASLHVRCMKPIDHDVRLAKQQGSSRKGPEVKQKNNIQMISPWADGSLEDGNVGRELCPYNILTTEKNKKSALLLFDRRAWDRTINYEQDIPVHFYKVKSNNMVISEYGFSYWEAGMIYNFSVWLECLYLTGCIQNTCIYVWTHLVIRIHVKRLIYQPMYYGQLTCRLFQCAQKGIHRNIYGNNEAIKINTDCLQYQIG